MFYLGFALSLLSTVLYIFGAVAVTGILIYGVYALFTQSIINGLAFIGGSMIGALIGNVICGWLKRAGLILISKSVS